jgi:putative heme degradation protein
LHPHLDERVPLEQRGFHSRDGLFFRRNEDGSVSIIASQSTAVRLAENEWASVVASVSAEGETHERWQAVRDFHGAALDAP